MELRNMVAICCIIFSGVFVLTAEASPKVKAQAAPQGIYKALHPGAYLPEVASVPLAPRLPDLNGKTVCLITISSPKDPAIDALAAKAAEYLGGRRAQVIRRVKTTAYMADDKALWDDVKKSADAFIYFGTAQGSSANAAAQWSATLEKTGIPGVNVVFDVFYPGARATVEKLGTMVRIVQIPIAFDKITDAQLADVMAGIEKALTAPLAPEEKRTGIFTPPRPPRIAREGSDEEIRKYFSDADMTDGLPIIIPTEENVSRMLKGTSHKPGEVITKRMPPGDFEVTVEKVAINGVMAGCKPEYMPVLLAMSEAIAGTGPVVVSTNSFSFMTLVNGPIRNQIGMNAGVYALSPGNQANATIGRALSLFIRNLGGGKVGQNLMGTQGNVSLYSFCFPENEEKSPWEPFHVTGGFKPEQSTITMFSGGWSHLGNYLFEGIEKLANGLGQFEFPDGAVVIMSPPKAKMFSEKGFSKQDMEQRIWEGATTTMKSFKDSSYYRSFIEPVLKGREMGGEKYLWPKEYLDKPDDAVIQAYPRKHIKVIVSGGEINDAMQGWKMSNPITVDVDKWR